MKIIFMGTPQFAVPSLNVLLENNYDVMAVVTQPDKPKGRKQILTPPEVKVQALKFNIPVLQPQKVKQPDIVKKLEELKPDLIVVVAFGQILPQSILKIPAIGCINVHASLLPKYRGAAPIQWAIINGERETGVTIMWMDEGMDTGDIFLQEKIVIEDNWTSEDLSIRLSNLGADLLLKSLKEIERGNLLRIPQEDKKATYAPILKKEHGLIHWYKSAKDIYNLIRGTYPWPGAYTFFKGQEIKIWKAQYRKDQSENPGRIIKILKNEGILVGTGDGTLLITELQETGRKRMKAWDYVIGHPISEGDEFGN
ncbi:methionyl-tRNA formyltransferase [Thermovenabulum gondwanense]|uniref:Methionyl-tRNA formyltransferase n=1 Tax=Thermovenabulum gondwanense TaxID=520767 RepID=A0A162MMY0_9FIRM|nr:methionyl-tRNA formyltransferase [Thermovenabulum gondwanense]KYO66750.1 Methionyl-tRNA formyltransferase [Thermovenabulum gondwanense]